MSGPLNLDSVRISSTANGFLVYVKGPDRIGTESDMYSFESLSSMIGWLQANLKNNGSRPFDPFSLKAQVGIPGVPVFPVNEN